MSAISGTFALNVNILYAGLFNMLISQTVFTDNIKGVFGKLVDEARVDGSLYGDSKAYYASDCLKSSAWLNDAEAANLLALNRDQSQKIQVITMDVFRMVWVTTDEYLSKQAWMNSDVFGQFISSTVSKLQETKKVYDATTYNSFIGTHVSGATKATISVDVTSAIGSATGEEANRLEAGQVATDIANLLVHLSDVSRDYNDYKFLRSYNLEELKVVWNNEAVNKIKKFDLPSLYHQEGLIDKFAEDLLPERYFGTIITAANKSTYAAATPTTGKPIDSDDDTYVPGTNNANGCIRTLIETEVTVGGDTFHLFPGDEIPAGATIKTGGDFELGDVYIQDEDIICIVMHKNAVPFMSGFSVSTEFNNPRSLTKNNYLIWGHNTLEALKDKPFIRMKKI